VVGRSISRDDWDINAVARLFEEDSLKSQDESIKCDSFTGGPSANKGPQDDSF